MRDTALRFVWRGGLVTVALAIIAFLSLAAYCAVETATYVSSSQPFTGTVVDIERPAFENQRNDFRPVVEATLPSGESFTGLFRPVSRFRRFGRETNNATLQFHCLAKCCSRFASQLDRKHCLRRCVIYLGDGIWPYLV